MKTVPGRRSPPPSPPDLRRCHWRASRNLWSPAPPSPPLSLSLRPIRASPISNPTQSPNDVLPSPPSPSSSSASTKTLFLPRRRRRLRRLRRESGLGKLEKKKMWMASAPVPNGMRRRFLPPVVLRLDRSSPWSSPPPKNPGWYRFFVANSWLLELRISFCFF